MTWKPVLELIHFPPPRKKRSKEEKQRKAKKMIPMNLIRRKEEKKEKKTHANNPNPTAPLLDPLYRRNARLSSTMW